MNTFTFTWLLLKLGLIVSLLSTLPTTSSANENVKAAYWIQDTIPSENIDSTLFTHLFCAFADLNSSTNTISLPDESFSEFSSSVRTKNPSVKTLLSIGGGGSSAQDFSSMTASVASREAFIDSTISVSRSNSFDGLDLAYEIPSSPSDMSNLGLLFSQWREEVEAEARSTNRPRLLLTASVRYTNTDYPPDSDPYPAQAIASNLDWINLMAYDFTAPASWGSLNKTGPTAALYDPTGQVSGSDGVNAWIQGGVPASKIVLSIPLYGYAWKLTDPNDHGYGAIAEGPTITENGAVNYKEVVEFLKRKGGAKKVYDSSRKANYCYNGDTWISYDDVEAVAAKVEYAVGNGLLGYVLWQIGGDEDAFTLSATATRSLPATVPIFLGALCYD